MVSKKTQEYRDWFKKNKKHRLKYKHNWYQENKSKLIKENNEYMKQRKKLDKNYLLKCRLRTLLRLAINRYVETGKIQDCKKYPINIKAIIFNLTPFPQDLYKYELDHIKPLSKFDLTNPKEIKKAFSPKNIRWLLIIKNKRKSNK